MRLSHKLLFAAGLSLASAAGLHLQAVVEARGAAVRDAGEGADAAMHWADAQVRDITEATRSVMQAVASEAARGDSGMCARVGMHVRNRFPDGRVTVELRDRFTNPLCGTPEHTDPQAAAQIERVIEAATHRNSFASAGAFQIRSEGASSSRIPFALPWTGEGGARGVVLAFIDPAILEDMYTRRGTAPGTTILFLSREWQIRASLPPGIRGNAPSQIKDAALGGSRTAVKSVWTATGRIVAEPVGDVWDGVGDELLVVARSEAVHLPGLRDRVPSLARDGALALALVLIGCAVGRRHGIGSPRTQASRGPGAPGELEQGRLYKAIVESSEEVMFSKTADGRYTMVNDAFLRVVGVTREQLIGTGDMLREWTPDGVKPAVDARMKVVSTGQPVVFDIDIFHHGFNQRRILNFSYMPDRNEAGEVVGMTAVGRDVTAARAEQAVLLRAKEAGEEASRSKTRFLAATSHDLRQPAQAAALYAGSLAKHVSGTAGEPLLDGLRVSLDSLGSLLQSLMGLAELESGAVTASPAPFPLSDLLDEISATHTAVAASKGIALVVVPSHATVRSDRVLLGRMLRNLVENAIKYTERGRVLVDCQVRGDAAHVEVRDSGIGIAPDDINRIWDEFAQLDNPERDRTRGLGLGLSVVRRLSELLDHPVTVRSEVGTGSSFCIEVPLAPGGEVRRALPAPATVLPAPTAEHLRDGAPGATPLVAVIDDEAQVREGLRCILEMDGFDVVACETAAEVMEGCALWGRAPSVIVADYRLRDNAVGSDAIREIRARLKRATPPSS